MQPGDSSSKKAASLTASEKAEQFLKIAGQFKLGDLPTEMSHPLTTHLSELAQNNLASGITTLREVELAALASLEKKTDALHHLQTAMAQAIARGGRVFFCGCGATGRLSVALETLWRELHPQYNDSVVSFIAGGDYAMVRSIENFEDHPEYGARQLNDLGFNKNDLLVASSEGGETPFVIGAVEEAARIAEHAPWFLFCNPKAILKEQVERSRKVIDNPDIRTFALETGPMAVAGSTRLQASTVLMLAAGAALVTPLGKDPMELVHEFRLSLRDAALENLAPLIDREAEIYSEGGYCCHETRDYGVTVLTDTTERSPTFSLIPFENRTDRANYKREIRPSWTYLSIQGAKKVSDAWNEILKRSPRALTWPEFTSLFGEDVLAGFDFDASGRIRRESEIGPNKQYVFTISRSDSEFALQLDGRVATFQRPKHLLVEHLLLKCVLNISSTLVMGRIGRFSGNRMIYVKATNNKLIDRSIRCVRALLHDQGAAVPSYEKTAHVLFEVLETISIDQPVVLLTVERILNQERA